MVEQLFTEDSGTTEEKRVRRHVQGMGGTLLLAFVIGVHTFIVVVAKLFRRCRGGNAVRVCDAERRDRVGLHGLHVIDPPELEQLVMRAASKVGLVPGNGQLFDRETVVHPHHTLQVVREHAHPPVDGKMSEGWTATSTHHRKRARPCVRYRLRDGVGAAEEEKEDVVVSGDREKQGRVRFKRRRRRRRRGEVDRLTV